jgi:hypothetical protein
MFSLNTLTALIQRAGFSVVRSEVVDLQQARPWDDRPPEVKQIRIIARKSDNVTVTWPNPVEELGALLRAQLEFDRSETIPKRKKRALESSVGPIVSYAQKAERLLSKWKR